MERCIINNTLKLQNPKIKKIEARDGYGERYVVSSKYRFLYDFFITIGMWNSRERVEEDGTVTKWFELPHGITLNNSPILQFVMKKYSVEIENYYREDR